jgi:2-dehydropantoate 2-reductase
MSDALPRVAVMGAGALGCFFGGKLAQAGAQVTLIGRAATVDAIKRDGLTLESGGTAAKVHVDATVDPNGARGAKLVLVCVKSGDTARAAEALAPHLERDAVLVSLQNGVGNVERIHAATSRRVVAGLVYIGTNMPAPAHVRHSGGDRIVLGAIKGCGADEALVGDTAAIFRKAGINVEVSADIEAGLWHKLMLNCAYNAICALTGKPYGEMGAVPEVRAVMQQAAEEVIVLARRKGAAIPAAVFDDLFTMTQSMPQQMSSTAQDIAKGRATEIDYLNGYVARESDALGLAAPVNRTLNALVKLREKTGDRLSPARPPAPR